MEMSKPCICVGPLRKLTKISETFKGFHATTVIRLQFSYEVLLLPFNNQSTVITFSLLAFQKK